MIDQSGAKSKGKQWPRKLLYAVLIVILLLFAYLFLLLGEPDADQKYLTSREQEHITTQMSPMEVTDAAGLQSLADTFCQPVLSLYSGATLQKARINDMQMGSEYARVVTLTYQLADGSTVVMKSVRPKEAASLFTRQDAELDADRLYSVAGMNAVRMQTSAETVYLAEGENAVYSISCPNNLQEDFSQLLHQTSLISPSENNQ